MADYGIDAVLYPTSTVPPLKIGQEQPFSQMNCELSAYSGLPAVTVPAGFTAADELPVGVELLSRPFTEPLLIALAYSYEQATMHRKSPSKFGSLE
jgi:amidase